VRCCAQAASKICAAPPLHPSARLLNPRLDGGHRTPWAHPVLHRQALAIASTCGSRRAATRRSRCGRASTRPPLRMAAASDAFRGCPPIFVLLFSRRGPGMRGTLTEGLEIDRPPRRKLRSAVFPSQPHRLPWDARWRAPHAFRARRARSTPARFVAVRRAMVRIDGHVSVRPWSAHSGIIKRTSRARGFAAECPKTASAALKLIAATRRPACVPRAAGGQRMARGHRRPVGRRKRCSSSADVAGDTPLIRLHGADVLVAHGADDRSAPSPSIS
jgi:hypothetical protein